MPPIGFFARCDVKYFSYEVQTQAQAQPQAQPQARPQTETETETEGRDRETWHVRKIF